VLKGFSVVKSVSGLAEPTSVGLIWISTLTLIEFPGSNAQARKLESQRKVDLCFPLVGWIAADFTLYSRRNANKFCFANLREECFVPDLMRTAYNR
jgi:hypothetical protein